MKATIYINGKKYKAKPRFFILVAALFTALAIVWVALFTEVSKMEREAGYYEGASYTYAEWVERVGK